MFRFMFLSTNCKSCHTLGATFWEDEKIAALCRDFASMRKSDKLPTAAADCKLMSLAAVGIFVHIQGQAELGRRAFEGLRLAVAGTVAPTADVLVFLARRLPIDHAFRAGQGKPRHDDEFAAHAREVADFVIPAGRVQVQKADGGVPGDKIDFLPARHFRLQEACRDGLRSNNLLTPDELCYNVAIQSRYG